MLVHVPSFGRNPRGSPDFLAYPVPKACMHVLGTRVPRRLGVARSASSPKAAQALGCSLTPGLRISFGRVTCMARAASVPGLWALGFLPLACVCGWVRVAVGRGFCLPLPVLAGVLGGCVWAPFLVLSLFCRLFVVFVVGLWCRPAFGTCVVSCAFPLPPAVSGSGVRCGRACWARVSAVPRPSWLGCRVVFFALFFFPVAGCPCPGLCGLSPRLLSFGLGCWLFFFFFSACFGVPFSGWPLFLAWCCRFWLSGPPVPVWGSCLRCPLGGGFGPLLCCWRAVWWLWRVFARPHSPPFFFWGGGGGGGLPSCSSLCLPSAGACSVAGVWCGWSLATPGGGSCVLLPATPGWVSLPVVVGGPRHSWLGSAGGGGVWCVAVVCWWGCGWCVVWLVPRHSWRRFLCATPRHSWLGFAAGGGGRSPPLLAGVRLRRWCVVCGVWRWCVGGVVAGVWCGWSLATPGGGSCVLLPATPGWVSLPVVVGGPRHSWLGSACGGGVWCVVCGVWCVAVVCWWGSGWCVVWLVPRHSWRRFLCATPRHSWLGFAAGGGGRSPPLLAGVRLRRWCVVCGVWRWCVGGVVAGVWCGWSLATPGGGSCVLLPATPGWVSLPVVVGGPRHSWLGSACGVGVWCVAVVCWWGCGWCVVWLVPRHSWRRSLCATPRHSWLGFAAGGNGRSPPLLAGVRWRRWCVVCGVWCVVCCWGPSPLLAEVPVCYSPPLLAGFRCRWWWAVPATPGWGPLAAVVCGVWCVAVVCWWGRGWCVVWLVPRHPWRRFLCATPRHSWLGFAAGGGGRSPPLLAGVRLRRWCVVCGVWCVVCGGGVLVGLWLVCGVVGPSPLLAEVPVCYSPPLLAGFRCRWWWAVPATPGWGPLAAVVCGVWCVAVVCWWGCGWCVVWLVPRHSWRRFLCATPRHSWLGFAAGGGGRSPPLLAGVRLRHWCVVCGGGVLVGLWLVCGVVGPSPLLAEVPVCYSPPLLAGFRCRW